jgi:hypothetical protein
MKTLKHISALTFILSLFHCSSIPKIQKNAPTEFEDVYFQKWNAGIQEGGSGVNIFIKAKDESVALDSVYFRANVAKLIVQPNDSKIYVGRITSKTSSSVIPFSLEPNECVISYLVNDEVLYYKISGVKEKETINYPSSPPNN